MLTKKQLEFILKCVEYCTEQCITSAEEIKVAEEITTEDYIALEDAIKKEIESK